MQNQSARTVQPTLMIRCLDFYSVGGDLPTILLPYLRLLNCFSELGLLLGGGEDLYFRHRPVIQ